MTPQIEIRGLRELFARMSAFPMQLSRAVKKTMEASLLHVQGSVPPYPQAPEGVNARGRTGLLGRTLGRGMSGGNIGRAAIHEIKMGAGGFSEGRFGTNVEYAEKVIGETQQSPWSGYWWNILQVAEKARPGVIKLFHAMGDELAKWLDRK